MAMTRYRKKIVYYARGKGITRMGPYASVLKAWQALRGKNGEPIPEATVWPEEQLVELPEKKS